MHKFSAEASNCILIMYPTGGYGNFLYYLMSEHLASTVKQSASSWNFINGNSHQYPKYTETFKLGQAEFQGTTRSFRYDYGVKDEVLGQINAGKQFLVLADVGNKGDNIKFLRKYFPNAIIARIISESFIEKLIVWANGITKSNQDLRSKLYPGSILTTDGVAKWANKSVDSVTDLDAVNCMADFFKSNFSVYGKMFAAPIQGAINIPVSSFFNEAMIYQALQLIATQLNTDIVNNQQLKSIITKFVECQEALTLLRPGKTFPLVREALKQYETID